MASLKITERKSGDVTLLDIAGKLTIGDGDIVLRSAVRNCLEQGQNRIVLNLTDVTSVDSSGLGELVSSYTTASNRGAKLKLLNPAQKITDLLHITQLISVFEVFDNEKEALDSFN
jgi:anti-sigma B factor antagonist